MSLSLCGDFQSLAHQVTLIVHEKNPKFNYAMNLKSKIWIKKSMNTSAIFYDTVLTASQKPADKTKKSTIQKWCWYFDVQKWKYSDFYAAFHNNSCNYFLKHYLLKLKGMKGDRRIIKNVKCLTIHLLGTKTLYTTSAFDSFPT